MGIELPGWLRYVGGLVGEKFPEGDETACRRQRDRWQHYADQLEGLKGSIEAAGRVTLDGFAAGATHDQMADQFSTLTSGDASIDNIVQQLRQLAHAVDEAATEIEFAKQMFIVNLGILAASLAALVASAWINWGAPAEMAAAIAATEAVLAQIIRAAIGKLVSAAALRVITRLAIKALEGALVNAAISGGMNAAVQGGQIFEGHRHGFDLGSFGQDLGAGAIQGAVAAPFLRGVHDRTPGFHPSERLSDFGRSFVGNTAGGLAAQAPSGKLDPVSAARSGGVFGVLDGVRPTPKSVKNDWREASAPADQDRASPHPPVSATDGPPQRAPASSQPALSATDRSPGGSTTHRPDNVDVPLNLGPRDHGVDASSPTHSGAADAGAAAPASNRDITAPAVSEHSATPPATAEPASFSTPASSDTAVSSSASPRASVTDAVVSHPTPPAGASAAHSAESVMPQGPTGRDASDPTVTRASSGAADSTAPPRVAEPADSGQPARAPEHSQPAPSPPAPSRGPDRVDAALPLKGPDRVDAAATKPEGARLSDSAHPRVDAGKQAGVVPAGDPSARPVQPDLRSASKAGADNTSVENGGEARFDPEQRHQPDSPDADTTSPPGVFGPVLYGVDGTPPHTGSLRTASEARHPTTNGVSHQDHADSSPREVGQGRPETQVGLAGDVPVADAGHVEPSELPAWRLKQIELALSPDKLERDLLDGGCPPEIAASARRSPYAELTRQELLARYFTSDGSVRWPPHDGFADGKYEVADRIPKGQALDRIGEVSSQRGEFLAGAGDSYPARALAPGTSGPYHRVAGTGRQLPVDWELRHGAVAAHFDQPGGGKQWVVVDRSVLIDGEPRKVLVKELLAGDYCRVVELESRAPVDEGHRAPVQPSDDDAPHRRYNAGHPTDDRRPATPGHDSDYVRAQRDLDSTKSRRQLVRDDRIDRIHRLIDDYREDGDDHQPLFHGEELTADERRALREVWHQLSPAEQRYLYLREPMFGEHAELPVEVCDDHARQAIRDLRSDLIDDIDMREMVNGHRLLTRADLDRLRILDNLEHSVEPPEGEQPRFLLGFELDGRSITSVGNPDTATHTVVFAPGTFTSDERLNESVEARGFKNWYGLRPRFDRPGYMEISERILDRLSVRLDDAHVAVVDYQNYHAPQSLVPGAARAGYAVEGAPTLRNHLDRLQYTNQTEHGEIWVVGHSYGTTLVGEAAKGGHGLNADGIVNLGSPGLRVDDVSGLKLKGVHLVPGHAPVHTMTRVDDPIRLVDGARITGLRYLDVGHGLMPHHPVFGGHVWDVDTDAGWHRDPHNAYFDRDGRALRYIADIVAGDEAPSYPPRQWSTGSFVPFTLGYLRAAPSGQLLGDSCQDPLRAPASAHSEEPR